MQQLQNSFKIGITGMGLIGGSIYKCLVKNGFKNIFAHTSNDETLAQINCDGFIADRNIEVLKDCDLVFVCSPISETFHVIKKVFEINKNAIIVDVASLKAEILEKANELVGCKFIGSHPMAGTEHAGFKNAFAELFEGAKWVLTPSNAASAEDIELLKKLIVLIGATPIEMEPKSHDETVAMISHAPMLIAQALMGAATNEDFELKLAASGFRDMTRLAVSNKIMAKDMLSLNKQNIKNSLEKMIAEANKLLQTDYFEANIDKIIETRRNLYNEEGKNVL